MTPRQARIGVDIFTFLVAASVGVALAGLTWRLLGDPGTRYAASPVAARAVKPVDIAPLIALAPFGSGGGPASAIQATNQPLTLRGIILAQPRTASSALIALGDAAPVAFFAGQTVGNATIDAIEVDHVVLLSGGQRSLLAFPNPMAGAALATSPLVQPSISTAAPSVIPAPSPNSNAMLESFGATASGAGLSVSNPNPVMRMAGVQAGDQIVAINGQPATEVARNPALLQPIIAAGSARVDIVRAGQRMTLSVPIR